MQRRNFLGSMIGLVAASPFLALLHTEQQQRKHLVDALGISLTNCINGHWVQAPGIKEIVQDGNSWVFISETLKVTEQLLANASGVIIDGKIVSCCGLDSSYVMLPGDKYDVTYKITGGNRMSLEALAAMLKKRSFDGVIT
jgi:hypothetical protein